MVPFGMTPSASHVQGGLVVDGDAANVDGSAAICDAAIVFEKNGLPAGCVTLCRMTYPVAGQGIQGETKENDWPRPKQRRFDHQQGVEVKKKLFNAAAVCALMCTQLPAHAVVMAFDDLPMLSHQYELQGISDINTDIFYKGYRLVYAPALGEPYPAGLAAVGPKWRFNGRSVALLINTCLGSLTITSEDNNPFSAKSIDLGTSNGDPTADVTFYGTTPEGELVSYSAQAGPGLVWKRFEFPASFGRLQSLMWKQGDCINNMPHMFDNLELTR